LATFIQSTQGIIDNFLDDCIPWSQEMSQVYERGAWIRCYGVPLIAWNSIFFAELVESQGRLLLIDECTVSKQRMGFARILIVTTSMKEINVSVKVRINNIETNISIIEDPGFDFAKDACLVEEEDDNDSQFSLHTGMQDDDPFIEEFVQHLQEDWANSLNNNNNNEVNKGGCNSGKQASSTAKKDQICTNIRKVLLLQLPRAVIPIANLRRRRFLFHRRMV
jgi:hypothetical protein